jgi:hypothetical protein
MKRREEQTDVSLRPEKPQYEKDYFGIVSLIDRQYGVWSGESTDGE